MNEKVSLLDLCVPPNCKWGSLTQHVIIFWSNAAPVLDYQKELQLCRPSLSLTSESWSSRAGADCYCRAVHISPIILSGVTQIVFLSCEWVVGGNFPSYGAQPWVNRRGRGGVWHSSTMILWRAHMFSDAADVDLKPSLFLLSGDTCSEPLNLALLFLFHPLLTWFVAKWNPSCSQISVPLYQLSCVPAGVLEMKGSHEYLILSPVRTKSFL